MPDQIDIKEIRLGLEMSQTAFARAIGVDQSTVSTWEKKGLPKNQLIRESLDRRLDALRRLRPVNAA